MKNSSPISIINGPPNQPSIGIISIHRPMLINIRPIKAMKQPPRETTRLDPHLGQGSQTFLFDIQQPPFVTVYSKGGDYHSFKN